VLVLAVLGIWLVLQPPIPLPDLYQQIVTVHALLTLFPLLAASTVLAAATSYHPGDQERRVWVAVALACLAWAGGRALFGYTYIAEGHLLPYPSAAEVFTAASFVLFLAALRAEYGIVSNLVTRSQMLIAAVIGLAGLATGYTLFLRPIVVDGITDPVEVVSVAIAVMGAALIWLSLIPAMVFLGGLAGYAWLLIAGSVICLALSVMWFANAVLFGEWFVGHRSNVLQIAGFGLLTVGALWGRSIMVEA
jgi:hypothetical protein